MRYCGREFSDEDRALLDKLIKAGFNRRKLSEIFCEEVRWLKPDGGLKDMSCRVALLRMHRDGHIILPAPTKPCNKNKRGPKRTLLAEPQPEIQKKAGEYELEITIVNKDDSALWNEYIERYHYLG